MKESLFFQIREDLIIPLHDDFLRILDIDLDFVNVGDTYRYKIFGCDTNVIVVSRTRKSIVFGEVE